MNHIALRELSERAVRLEASHKFCPVKCGPSLFDWGMEGPFDLAVSPFVRSFLATTPALNIMFGAGLNRNIHGAVGASAGGMYAIFVAADRSPTMEFEKRMLTRSNILMNSVGDNAHPSMALYVDMINGYGLPLNAKVEDLPKPSVVPMLCFNTYNTYSRFWSGVASQQGGRARDENVSRLIFLNSGLVLDVFNAAGRLVEDSVHGSRPWTGAAPLVIDGLYPCMDGALGDGLGVEGLESLTPHPSSNGARRVMLLKTGSFPSSKPDLLAKQYPGNVTEAAVMRLVIPPVAQIECGVTAGGMLDALGLSRCGSAPGKLLDVVYSNVANVFFKPMKKVGAHDYIIDTGISRRLARWLTYIDHLYNDKQAAEVDARFRYYHRDFGVARREYHQA